jgi:hypothetical protein
MKKQSWMLLSGIAFILNLGLDSKEVRADFVQSCSQNSIRGLELHQHKVDVTCIAEQESIRRLERDRLDETFLATNLSQSSMKCSETSVGVYLDDRHYLASTGTSANRKVSRLRTEIPCENENYVVTKTRAERIQQSVSCATILERSLRTLQDVCGWLALSTESQIIGRRVIRIQSVR